MFELPELFDEAIIAIIVSGGLNVMLIMHMLSSLIDRIVISPRDHSLMGMPAARAFQDHV